MRRIAAAPPLNWQLFLASAICGLFITPYLIPSVTVFLLIPLFNKALWQTRNLAVYAALFMLVAFGSHSYFAAISIPSIPDWAKSGKTRICAEIQSVQALPEKRLRIILKNIHPENRPEIGPLAGEGIWTWENAPINGPLTGQSVCITRFVKHFGGFSNDLDNNVSPGFSRFFWRIWSDGEKGNPEFYGEPSWLAKIRQEIFLKFLLAIAPRYVAEKVELSQGKAIIVALLFGDRRFLSQKTVTLFGEASLAHSLALSGQHLGIAVLLSFLVVSMVAVVIPDLYLWRSKTLLVALFSLPPALFYLWLGGAPASLLRAFGMLFFFVCLLCAHRIYNGFDLLLLTLLAFLLLQPKSLFETGLQMSALCIAVILITSPVISKLGNLITPLPGCFYRILKRLIQLLALAAIIQLALLPYTLAHFQQTGFWFILNILWLPVLGIFILPLSVLGLLFSIPDYCWTGTFGEFFLNLASYPCSALITFLDFLKQNGAFTLPVFISPHWTIYIAFALGLPGCAALLVKPAGLCPASRGTKFIVASLCVFAIAPTLRIFHGLNDSLSVEALDVGQAQSILLSFPENGKIILDGGGSKSTRFDPGRNIISPILVHNSAPALSTVISSHPDLDHVGGLFYLLEKFDPCFLFHNDRSANSGLQEKWNKAVSLPNAHGLVRGDRLILGEPAYKLAIEVLHPPLENRERWQGNSASLILRLTRDGKGLALFTGDAEKDAIRELVDSGQDISAEIVFAPHHGSDRSFHEPFYRKANPRLVIASCGYENRWNYPGRKLRKFLENNDVPLLDTGNNGRIKVKFSEALNIETAKK